MYDMAHVTRRYYMLSDPAKIRWFLYRCDAWAASADAQLSLCKRALLSTQFALMKTKVQLPNWVPSGEYTHCRRPFTPT